MVDLSPKSPCGGLLPVSIGGCELSECSFAMITSISPAKGQQKTVSQRLKKELGLGFPAPNRSTQKDDMRCIWTGPGQAFLIGPEVRELEGAALSDQTDGWARMQIKGGECVEVLARLVPVDLRRATFRPGHTARTKLFHVGLSITRTGENQFELLVFRSMAKTVIDELSVAMKSVAALNA